MGRGRVKLEDGMRARGGFIPAETLGTGTLHMEQEPYIISETQPASTVVSSTTRRMNPHFLIWTVMHPRYREKYRMLFTVSGLFTTQAMPGSFTRG